MTHKQYLKKIKRETIIIKFVQIFILLFFLFIWQILSDKNIINSFIFSSPKKVISTILELVKDGSLFKHIWITLYETLISFFLGSILGILIASIMWLNKYFAKIINPYLTIINSLPKVALGPILIIWFGSGIKSIIIMALLISTIITIINIYEAFISVDPIKIKLLNSLKASKLYIYKNLILPSSRDVILNTLIINVSMSLIGVIMGEFLVSKEGIGYLIMYGSQIFNLNLVISGIIILCIIASLMYSSIIRIEKKLKSNN